MDSALLCHVVLSVVCNTALCPHVFAARPLHVPDLSCLQELYTCQLFVLVSPLYSAFCFLPGQKEVSHKNVCINPRFFLRYVIVECEDQDTQQRDPKTHEMYLNVMRRFSQALLKVRFLTYFGKVSWCLIECELVLYIMSPCYSVKIYLHPNAFTNKVSCFNHFLPSFIKEHTQNNAASCVIVGS